MFLNGLVSNPSRHQLFEKVVSGCGDLTFYFGTEPFDLNHKLSCGVLVSYWARDPKVTKLRLSYDFAISCLGVFGLGYGSRPTVPSLGLNCYNKRGGRETPFTCPSPTQDVADLRSQQYYREEYQHLILQPIVRKMINELSNGMLDFA